ncbi:MAG: flagellar hook-length control protein FliK [Acetivibrio sp.]
MTTQRVIAQNVNLFEKTENQKNTARSSEKVTSSFGQIMNKNMKDSEDKPIKSKNETSDAKDKTQEVEKNKEPESKPTEKIDHEIQKPLKDETLSKDKAEEISEEVEKIAPETLNEVMKQLQLSIMNTVKEVLQVPEEIIEKALQELDLTPMDLMDPSNMASLILKINDCNEPTQLLMDETMSSQLSKLTKALGELNLPKELGITKEEIMELSHKTTQNPMNEEAEKVVEILAGEKGKKEFALEPGKEEATKKTTTEKEITITVEKQETQDLVVKKDGKDTPLSQNSQKESNPGERQQANPPIETFVENLAAKGQDSNLSIESVQERVKVMRNIVEQVVEQIKVSIKPDTTSMEIQLNPENLGKINLSVASKDGHLTATITTQNEIAKEALESQMHILKENLNNQGLKVEAVEVNVSNFAFNSNRDNNPMSKEQGKSKNQNRRKIDLENFDEGALDVTEEEVLAAKVLKQNGGNVDYSA